MLTIDIQMNIKEFLKNRHNTFYSFEVTNKNKEKNGERVNMKLKDTIEMMFSEGYKDCFKVEYYF